MNKDIDEDLIEATIRRVQAQLQPDTAEESAASTVPLDDQAPASPGAGEAPPDSRPADVGAWAREGNEDPIEATIRRVQAQAEDRATASDESVVTDRALSAEDADETGAGVLDPIEATIRRVRAQASAHAEAGPQSPPPQVSAAVPEDDSAIAATIARVRAQAAARHDESSAFAPTPLPALEDDPEPEDDVEHAIEFAERQTADDEQMLANDGEEDPIEGTSWPGRDERLLGEPQSWDVAARRLEQGLQETNQELRVLTARFEALLPILDQFAASDGAPLRIVPPTNEPSDEVARVTPMQAPRRYVDPTPTGATARRLIEADPEPSPRLRALDEHGNLNDHLPRQYRITVEDKRRGVDLVPLHRAMQGMENVKDMSLLSYSNGVAIVAVESIGAIDPDNLGAAVARCMSRATQVEVHNEQTMVVKIQEE